MSDQKTTIGEAVRAAARAAEAACEGELGGIAIRDDAAHSIARHTVVAFLKAAHALPGETREWTLREWALALEALPHG